MLTFPAVKLGPLEYLYPGVPFTDKNFPDLWWPIMIAAGVFLIVTVVLYNVRVRQLHRFEPQFLESSDLGLGVRLVHDIAIWPTPPKG